MTSSNGSIFRVTGPLLGQSTSHRSIPLTKPVAWSFDFVFDLRLNKRLSKQSRRRWFETPSRSLWRHCNAFVGGARYHIWTLQNCHSVSNHLQLNCLFNSLIKKICTPAWFLVRESFQDLWIPLTKDQQHKERLHAMMSSTENHDCCLPISPMARLSIWPVATWPYLPWPLWEIGASVLSKSPNRCSAIVKLVLSIMIESGKYNHITIQGTPNITRSNITPYWLKRNTGTP